ncbi:MHYT domain-containing protein [Nocardia sp. NPDC024068]|uniref:MHYT domain-containing protein n=1 Tax=Nocardia sp. NPDC024068 TaxID=3157197 RepID=UPI0033C6F73C
MLHLEHFSNGWVTPVLAFFISFIGSVLGLRCAVRARTAQPAIGWLVAAAVALGGAGIWVMHFTAMLGFTIDGTSIRYDMPMTLLSAAIAIVVVLAGLAIVVRGHREAIALPLGGAVTGLGVAAMHYLGMAAMNSGASMEYGVGLVLLSLVIAVVAATAALWFMLHVQGWGNTIGAGLIMAVAVCGMHYTGMAAMSAHHTDHHGTPEGAAPVELLTPLLTTVALVVVGLVVLVGVAELEVRSIAVAGPAPEPEDIGTLTTDPATLALSGRQWPRQPLD